MTVIALSTSGSRRARTTDHTTSCACPARAPSSVHSQIAAFRIPPARRPQHGARRRSRWRHRATAAARRSIACRSPATGRRSTDSATCSARRANAADARGSVIRSAVAVRDQQAGGPVTGRPGRPARSTAPARRPTRTDVVAGGVHRGPPAHRVPDERDRHVREAGGEPVERPAHVGDRGALVAVPPAHPVAQLRDGQPVRAGGAVPWRTGRMRTTARLVARDRHAAAWRGRRAARARRRGPARRRCRPAVSVRRSSGRAHFAGQIVWSGGIVPWIR